MSLWDILESLIGIDAYLLSCFPDTFELHRAIHKGKERVVLAFPDVRAWMKFCASLPNQDASRSDDLSTIPLYS